MSASLLDGIVLDGTIRDGMGWDGMGYCVSYCITYCHVHIYLRGPTSSYKAINRENVNLNQGKAKDAYYTTRQLRQRLVDAISVYVHRGDRGSRARMGV